MLGKLLRQKHLFLLFFLFSFMNLCMNESGGMRVGRASLDQGMSMSDKELNKQGDFPRKAVSLRVAETDSEEVKAAKFSKLATSPEFASYRVINACELNTVVGEMIDVPSLIDELKQHVEDASSRSDGRAEALLINQATALQSLFTRLVEKAMTSNQINQFDAFMRLALRAQAQCRATVEALSSMKVDFPRYGRQTRTSN
jgi:hypothetical protein